MIKKPRLPELSLLSSAEPFKKKKSLPKPITNENQIAETWKQFTSKSILGKNLRANKSFGNPVEQNVIPLKPILKNTNVQKPDIESVNNHNLQTIDVEELPRGSKQVPSQKHIADTLNEKRSRFFSIQRYSVQKVEQKIQRKSFLEMMGESDVENEALQKSVENASNDLFKGNKNKHKRYSLRQQMQLPKNYDTVRQYLDNNCLHLENAIQTKLSRHSYLREKKNAKRQSLIF